MPVIRNTVSIDKFNAGAVLPYELRTQEFQMAMQETGNAHCNIAQGGNSKAPIKLGLSTLMLRFRIEARELENRVTRHFEIISVFFHSDACVTNSHRRRQS